MLPLLSSIFVASWKFVCLGEAEPCGDVVTEAVAAEEENEEGDYGSFAMVV